MVAVYPSTRRLPRARTSDGPKWFANVDWTLAFLAIATALFGLLMIFSATRFALERAGISPRYYVNRQVLFFGFGVIAMFITSVIDYRRLLDWAAVLYVGTCAMLLAVKLPGIGSSTRGTQAWFQIGPLQFQPSEFAKVSMAVCVAAFAANKRGAFTNRRLITLIVLAGIPMGLVFLQGDLGTSLVFGVMLLGVLMVSGAKARQIAGIAVVALIALLAAIQLNVLKDYQVNRLTSFTKQSQSVTASTTSANDPSYNLNQAKKAIGSGGMTGKGLFKAPLTNLAYVPEQKTDFIFTAVGEQFGFIGAAGLISVLALMAWRVWRIGMSARDHAGTLICVGVLAMLVFQIFENVGMTMGIMPITGIPLPFISYGGTSLVACFAATGLAINVGLRR